MGLFNEHSSSSSDTTSSGVQGPAGPPGPAGIGYKLTSDGNYDIENKKLINVKNGDNDNDVMVKSQIEGDVSNKIQESKIDGSNFVSKAGDTMSGDLILPKYTFPIQGSLDKSISYETIREIFLSRKETRPMEQSLDMGNHIIENLKSPTAVDHACNKGYTDNLVISKADKSDLDEYFKIDGSLSMTGPLNMNNNRILRLPDPQLADEPVTRKFLTQTNTLFYNIFLDLDGNAQMRADLKMNGNNIKGLTKSPNSDDEATNKKYVDSQISKSNIKPSHTQKNVFKYLMNDVNEWSSEYNIKVGSFSDLAESPHTWNKRVLNITPIKDGNNYRFRLGLQMFPIETDKSYSLIVELYNRDYKTWLRQQTFVEGTGIWLKSYNRTKFQHRYGSSGDLYYSKSLIMFKKTSTTDIWVYFTVHFDDKGGDMNTYQKDIKNQVYIVAYGIVGETDHVDSEVYDAHEAFEIDKTKMKMLVPLDMNGKQLMNVNLNLNLKFGDIFKIIKCETRYSSDRSHFFLVRKDNNHVFSFSVGVYINSITFHNKHTFDKNARIRFNGFGLSTDHEIILSSLVVDTGLVRNLTPWLEFSRGLRIVRLNNLINNLRFPFDVDVIVSYM